MSRELALPGVSSDGNILGPKFQLNIQNIEKASNQRLRNLVFAQNREAVARLPIQRLLQNVPEHGHSLDFVGVLVSVEKQSGFGRHAFQYNRTMRRDDNLQPIL